MKLKKNSLKTKIWVYLIIFSVLILSFLWFFQVVFLKSYYEWQKSKEVKNSLNKIVKNYDVNDTSSLDDIAYNNGVCIEIISNKTVVYISDMYSRGCISQNMSNDYHKDFQTGNLKEQKYNLVNPKFDNKTLVYASKIDDYTYVFVSASLEPLDATTSILQSQLFYVTIVVLALSLLVAYFISKKISNPIVKINESASKLASGNYNVVFKTDDDIDEINELVGTLNHTRYELSKTDNLRREIMANVSHDLKTPLTMIKAYSEMVRDITYKDKEKREQNLNTIIEETDRLNLLVNDILILSELESNVIKLNYENFNLTDLINNIVKKYDYLKRDKYKIIFDYQEELIINADMRKIEQVLYNLINNAINYTGKDKKVTIKITNEKDTYKVEVIDTGSGIKEDINLIWDKYYKDDKTHSRDNKGTGLGLSIVKNILENHNLKYGVNSTDKGTTFYFFVQKIKNNSSFVESQH